MCLSDESGEREEFVGGLASVLGALVALFSSEVTERRGFWIHEASGWHGASVSTQSAKNTIKKATKIPLALLTPRAVRKRLLFVSLVFRDGKKNKSHKFEWYFRWLFFEGLLADCVDPTPTRRLSSRTRQTKMAARISFVCLK